MRQCKIAVVMAAKIRDANLIANFHTFMRIPYGFCIAFCVYQHFCKVGEVGPLGEAIPDLACNCERLLVQTRWRGRSDLGSAEANAQIAKASTFAVAIPDLAIDDERLLIILNGAAGLAKFRASSCQDC